MLIICKKLLEYKTSLSTSFSFWLTFLRLLRAIVSDVHRSFIQNRTIYISQENKLQTRTYLPYRNAWERIYFLRKQNQRETIVSSIFFLYFPSSSKNSPPYTKQNFSYDHRARFNVLCTFTCCYLLLLEFLKNMHGAHHRFPRIREGEGQRPWNFIFISTVLHTFVHVTIKIFNKPWLVGGWVPFLLSFKLSVLYRDTILCVSCDWYYKVFFVTSFKIFLFKLIYVNGVK